jgi:hypothetical protein
MAPRKKYAARPDLAKARNRMEKGLRAQAIAKNRDKATADAVHHGTPQAQQAAMEQKAVRSSQRDQHEQGRVGNARAELASLRDAKAKLNAEHRAAEAKMPSLKTPSGESVQASPEQQARAAARKRTGKFQAGAHKGEATPAAIRGEKRAALNEKIAAARRQLAGQARKPDVLHEKQRKQVPLRGPDVLTNRTPGKRPKPLVPGQTIHTPEGVKVVGPGTGRRPRVGPKRIDGPKPQRLRLRRRRPRVQNSLY